MTSHGYPKNVFSRRMRDLSFEAHQKAKSPCPTEPRPYGSPRPVSGRSMASSFDIFREEDMENSSKESGAKAPKWAHRVHHMPTKDQQSDLNSRNGGKNVSKTRAPMSACSMNNKRSNRTQESNYFFENELRDSSESLPNPKLGRPTRTTILRARQRCQSAPVNGYDKRREHQKKFCQSTDFHKSLMDSVSNDLNDLVSNAIPSGETIHSYLTGARYNRKDYLDAKSLNEMGVYMPRNDPQNVFVVKGYATKKVPAETTMTPAATDTMEENGAGSSKNGQNYLATEEKTANAETLSSPSGNAQEVSNRVCESRVTSWCAHAINPSADCAINAKEDRKERRASYPGARGHKHSAQQSAHYGGPRRRSAADPSLGSLNIQGKAMVLGRAVPKTPWTSLKNSGLCPPTSTPRCQSVTALEVGRKLLAEKSGCCRCNCFFKTLIDSTLSVLAAENDGLLDQDCFQCDRCNLGNCPPDTDSNSQSDRLCHEASSQTDKTEYSSVTNSGATMKSSSFKTRHSPKMEYELMSNKLVERFETQFHSIPEAYRERTRWSPNKHLIGYPCKESEENQGNSGNTIRKEPKKVPLFVIDVKIKKPRKKRD